MMTAFVVPGRGGRVVTRAKKERSAFIRGQGRVPFRPMPSFGREESLLEREEGVWRTGTGVVATIRVRGVFGGGILVYSPRRRGREALKVVVVVLRSYQID